MAVHRLRQQFIDTGKRNRLTNAPVGKGRSKQLDIEDEIADEVFRILITVGLLQLAGDRELGYRLHRYAPPTRGSRSPVRGGRRRRRDTRYPRVCSSCQRGWWWRAQRSVTVPSIIARAVPG